MDDSRQKDHAFLETMYDVMYGRLPLIVGTDIYALKRETSTYIYTYIYMHILLQVVYLTEIFATSIFL